jgi:hypothetical protein
MYSAKASVMTSVGALVPYDHYYCYGGSSGFMDFTAYRDGLVPFDGATVGDALSFGKGLNNYDNLMQLLLPRLSAMVLAPPAGRY